MNIKRYSGLIENFFSLTLFKGVNALMPLIVIPHLILIVGSDNYGIYALAYALTFYLANIVQYGFSLSAVRLIAVNKENKNMLNEIYSNTFTTQLYLFGFCCLILFLLVFFVDKFNSYYLIYSFFTLYLIGELFSPMWFFQGIEKMRFITIVHTISKSTFVLLVFTLIRDKSDFIYISLYQSIGFFIAGLIAQIIIFKKFKIKLTLSPFREVKIILKNGLSAFLTMVTPTLYSNTSIFLVGIFGIPQYVTFMEIGSKVSGAFGALNGILTSAFYPFINRNKKIFHKVKYLFIVLGFTLSLFMFFLSDFLINIWLPDPSPEIIRVVKLLSPSPFLMAVISTFGVNGLMVQNKDKLYLKVVVIGSLIGLVACLILIPKYFYIGGAIAIILARTVKAILAYYYYKKFVKTNN